MGTLCVQEALSLCISSLGTLHSPWDGCGPLTPGAWAEEEPTVWEVGGAMWDGEIYHDQLCLPMSLLTLSPLGGTMGR